MVSSSLDKKEDTAVVRKNVNKSLQAVPRSKPLIKYRFYLDVKNRLSANKLEVKIRELGGELELFLVKTVTHIITDKEECYNSKGGGFYPKTPESVTNESYRHDSSNILQNTPTRGRPKTRADAMLERAKKTTTTISNDPLEQARSWGVTIWTVERAFTWLEKITFSVSVSTKKKNYKVFELKPPFIKFEAFDRQTRPVFQQIHNWPIFNIFGSAGDPGIVIRSTVERNMTRKTRSNHPRINTALQSSYCEVCRVEFPRLNEHLLSDKHLNFVKDNSNFLQLDVLINNSANIDNFLKINCGENIDELSCANHTHRKMPRTRTISLSDKIKNSPLSPTGSESGHRLRSRGQCSFNSYIQATGEEDGHLNKSEPRELRSSTRQLIKLVENEQKDTWDSGRPKRTCIKQKRSSAEDRLVLDNRMYYKVEVLSNKLRSGTEPTRDEYIKRAQTPAPPEVKENNKDKSLIVKFKRMRSSELKQLNNEAENFLFPKKDESSSEDDLDADAPETTASIRDGDSTLLLSSETDEPKEEEVKNLDEASLDSNWSESSAKKRKRRTHAEAFIADNQKYYKFETPGSRLRYHGSYLPPITNGQKSPKHNGEHPNKNRKSVEREKDQNKKEKQDVKPVKIDLERLQFSFERVPQSEPWYQTFRRQDQGQEYYTCFSDSGYWKPFLLPHQMGPIPPLDPRLCIKAYHEVKKHFLELSSASTSAGSNTPDPNCQDESSVDLQEDCSKASEDSNMTINTKTDDDNSKSMEIEQKRSRKNPRGIVSKNPRKSPRQHASTLAILSSLIHQRKRRNDANRSRSSDLNTSKNTLPSISEVDEGRKPPMREEPDYEKMAKSVDEMLSSMGDLEQLEISTDQSIVIDMNRKLSAIDILEDYDRKQKEGGSNLGKLVNISGKKPGRKKKKKNRTGWPNKNRRTKKGNDTIKEEEPDDNSTVGSLSVNADSDFNEENCDEGTENVDSMRQDNSVKHIGNSIDQSNNGAQSNVNISENVQTSRITTTENNPKPDRMNAISVSAGDNCTDKVCSKDSNDRIVDLDRWENAEKVLSAKVTNNEINNDIQFQPYVRVQKLDSSDVSAKKSKRRLRNSSSPHRTVKRPRRTPASPKSPRMLRKPRGRWYRER